MVWRIRQGRRKKDAGGAKKEEGRAKKEEGRVKKEEGRVKGGSLISWSAQAGCVDTVGASTVKDQVYRRVHRT